MDFTLSEEQQELQGLAKQILGDRMALTHLRELDGSEDWFDRETWAEFAKANLLGVALPEDVGGLGYGFLELALILVEQGRTVAPLPLLHTLVSVALPIAEFGTKEQRAELRGVVSGDVILTSAFNEIGTPPGEPQTVAERNGDSWTLTGEKVNVPQAHIAAGILVPARVGEEIGLFLVSPTADGVTLERQETMDHEPQFVVRLDRVAVSDAARLGEVADGRDNLQWVLDRTMTGICAISAGACQEALRITAEYTTTRKQFDRAIGTFQAVGQRMADSYIDTEAINLTMLQAATHLAENQASPTEVATAKYWAAEGGSRVVHAALHVHGGISIDLDYPIHRYFLWVKQNEFTLGAATPQLRDLGRMIAASA
ncbi:MAG TPA: acyl-CoA dehydrogenase family protein [Acidimicrobiia bacterium]|jgi:acyl-CoA dehydrogenase